MISRNTADILLVLTKLSDDKFDECLKFALSGWSPHLKLILLGAENNNVELREYASEPSRNSQINE